MNIPAYWFTVGVIRVQPFSAPGHHPLSPDPCPNIPVPFQGRQGTCCRSCSSSFNSIVEETGSRPDRLRPARQAAHRAGPDKTSRCNAGREPPPLRHLVWPEGGGEERSGTRPARHGLGRHSSAQPGASPGSPARGTASAGTAPPRTVPGARRWDVPRSRPWGAALQLGRSEGNRGMRHITRGEASKRKGSHR